MWRDMTDKFVFENQWVINHVFIGQTNALKMQGNTLKCKLSVNTLHVYVIDWM